MGISTVAVLDVCVPSSVFLYNNIRKVENGEKARGTVVFAQGAKIVEAVAKYHDNTAKSASEAFNIFGKYADKSKVLDMAGKGVNWATHHVNPLICMASGYKVLTSDDKLQTGISQAGAISGMFLGEGLMKRNMGKVINEENIVKLAEKVKDVKGLKTIAEMVLKGGAGGKVASIVKGIAFVCASMTSYDLGQKLGDSVASRVCADARAELPDISEFIGNDDDDDDDKTKTNPSNQKIDQMV
ncbi:hypothetical protein IKP85_01295 [bacterium]|nr:hypothetical protein [bacterium]